MRWNRIHAAFVAALVSAAPLTIAHAEEGHESWPSVVLPEVTTRVKLSSTDVNRLVCPDGIRDIVFSQEKGVKVKITDGNAFVKFQVIKKGEEMIYTEVPSEFFVVCGGDIYSLVGIPQRIPAQTIRLSSGKKQKIQQNISLFNGMPLEKKILVLIRQAYTDQIPESYQIREVNRQLNIFPTLWMSFSREIVVEGEGLAVREYRVSLKSRADHIRLSEQQFLHPQLTSRPLAVAVDELLLREGKPSRVFIVEQQEPDTPSPLIKRNVDLAPVNAQPILHSESTEVTDAS
jgi:conjugal transfer pilus assembly protein TraK